MDLNEKNNIDILLQENNVKKISKFSELNDIYDVDSLLDKDKFISRNNDKHIILFDTEIFNSCYLIDVLNETLKDVKLNKNVKLYYCNDIRLYSYIFVLFLAKIGVDFDIQKPKPCILYLDRSEIYVEFESLAPISTSVINIILDKLEAKQN